MKHKTQKTMET